MSEEEKEREGGLSLTQGGESRVARKMKGRKRDGKRRPKPCLVFKL